MQYVIIKTRITVAYSYDAETGLYYLQSRYYDPAVSRFINGDEITYTIIGNLCYNNFAYCVNNPIKFIDKSGRYINDQTDGSIENTPWGVGNVGDNGCGLVAVYNVLHSYSDDITFYDVIKGLYQHNGLWMFGLWGTTPSAITGFLKRKFLFLHTAGPITYWWGIKAELSGAVIVLYQHAGLTSQLHYVAGIKTGNDYGGKFKFYNDDYVTTKSISIWEYIDILKENGCKPLMFWGVAAKLGWW